MNSINAITLNKKIPLYGYPINRSVISLDDQKLMATIVLKGMPFESESSDSLEIAFTKVKGFLNQLAKIHGSKLAIWTHIVKRKDRLEQRYSFNSAFVQSFADKYVDTFTNDRFFKTEYYITFVLNYKGSLEYALTDFEDLLKTTEIH